jgi:hypothetical protein
MMPHTKPASRKPIDQSSAPQRDRRGGYLRPRPHLAKCRELVALDRWKSDADTRAFVKEATELITPPRAR